MEALAGWNEMNHSIRQRNKEKKDDYAEALGAWEVKRDTAKAKKR
jgi:hypothetical protein